MVLVGILGCCCVELNPFGPDQDQDEPTFTPMLIVFPEQTGLLAVAITLVKATQDGVIIITVVAVAVHSVCE